MSNTVLALLRTNPEAAFWSYGFIVDIPLRSVVSPGRCNIKCTKVNDNIYKLTLSNGGEDWYFPCVSGPGGGVGQCIIPVNQKDMVLALSTGMNGCALQVNKYMESFVFIHDYNSVSLMCTPYLGESVCRVQETDYAGPLYLGEKFVSAPTDANYFRSFQYTPICVHHEGKWKVYYSGVTYDSATKKYARIINWPLVTSFDDA